MQRQILVCDGPGCGCEQTREDPRAWLKISVVGGFDHQIWDFCPDCAAKLRELLPAGPERTTPAPPPDVDPEPAELEPHAAAGAVGDEPDVLEG